jgi:hypothetical protein
MESASSATLQPSARPPAAAWLPSILAGDAAARRGRRWLALALLLYGLLLGFAVPMGIGGSWRECDTQAIARNFLVDGFNPLRPRVDWRGDTDGAVECEFPLYQAMIASIMAFAGDVEWPGRILSLLAMIWAALSLHRILEARAGPNGALAGALVFLTGGHATMLGARVMPDALSTALALAGLATFLRYLASGSGASLSLATAATALAALSKPTALQIGLLMFLWTLLLAPRRLREPRLWLAFGTVLALVGAWLLHGCSLHAETGLTFGVASGGDTKFPNLRHLATPAVYLQLGRTTMRYGFSVLGAAALLWLLVRRRLDRADLALLATVVLALLGSLRYSYSSGMGPHYHVFAAVAGAWCVARAFPRDGGRLAWTLLLAAVAGQSFVHTCNERAWRHLALRSAQLPVAAAVAAASAPGDLAVVHAQKTDYDLFWRRRANYEEPMLLYNARRRGWVLPANGFDVAALEDLKKRGAKLIVDQVPAATPLDAARWLLDNGEVVLQHHGATVYRLRSQP